MTSKFRTTELSNPEFESNNLRFITVKTSNLNGRGDICVFVPPFKNLKNIPIVTLLHGVYGSAWIWAHKAGVHFTALKMMEQGLLQPMVLAMPSDGLWGDGSAYLPHNNTNYEQWIVNDVIDAVTENISCTSKNSTLFISGLSMGGYGALRLGVKYPNNYQAISAHSAITNTNQMHLFVEEDESNYNQKDRNTEDVFKLMLQNKESLPPIRFDCGKDDLLITHNRTLHQDLLSHQINHSYEEFEGAHEWPYWQEYIKKSLLFFNQFV
ncbi:carbohydrate esterase (CE1) [Formosa agariphila KMM 3901]|uniref:Carbohydrate esterase (CE1) n=1 Tax=Formosa agariphila (strain DSM 15362 / KCTC 12365 / LMG 23005 / KMM 3901 / M-2Alg 35-1) TaxID=1347342 RepID=T2KN01_FORAG|nr:alpha/beta hydrolase-fold protein [Formosa agariphila]CDF79818.1 carbohydrate esterase (CE1) [Formosa agariphila KMM 3901]